MAKTYKLVKEFKGIHPCSYHTFILEDEELVCVLPFSGKISFPMSVLLDDKGYFEEWGEMYTCPHCNKQFKV